MIIVALFGSCGSGEETEATGSNRGDFAYPSQWEKQPICENIEGLLFNLRGAVRGVGGDVFLMDGKPYSGIIKECEDGRNIMDLLEGPIAHNGFKRLN